MGTTTVSTNKVTTTASNAQGAPTTPNTKKRVASPGMDETGTSPVKRHRNGAGEISTSRTPSPSKARVATVPQAYADAPPPIECKCKKPALMLQARNGKPENYGRWFAKCQTCNFFKWASAPAPVNTSPNTPTKKTSSSAKATDLSSPASPSKSGVGSAPEGPPVTLTCYCDIPAYMFKARGGKPQNVGRWFGKCEMEKCGFFSPADAPQPPRDVRLVCDCGKPARMLQSKNGMDHNKGMWFGICATKKCQYWRWEGGGLPFGEEAVERFGETIWCGDD